MMCGCSCVKPIKLTPIVPNQIIKARVRVAYQSNLSHKLETRLNLAKAFLQLEKELGIRFDVVAETEFKHDEMVFVPELPAGLVQDLTVMQKGGECGALHINDGASTICIFEGTITPFLGEDYGVVLGAQSGPIIILSNLKDITFINVARHEIGHLLGAPHSKDLMSPGMPDEGEKQLLPFPQEAVDSIRKRLQANQ